ncbi:MAG: hypothetical protein WDN28_20580 [Chthoniobacter sp.]
MCADSEKREIIRWRPWPCDDCSSGTEAADYLVGRHSTSGEIPDCGPDEFVGIVTARERAWLEGVECPLHSLYVESAVNPLTIGSEHSVYLEPETGDVLKVTLPGVFGDFYFLKDGLVNQRCCTPVEYLKRLDAIERTFGFSAVAVGATAEGQIVTVQKFIDGDPPTQEEVDAFCLGKGLFLSSNSAGFGRSMMPNWS